MKVILKHTGFIILLALLSVVYIFNTHRAERKLRNIASLNKTVEEAKSEYQEVKSDINFKCTETELAKMLETKGLYKNEESPILLESES